MTSAERKHSTPEARLRLSAGVVLVLVLRGEVFAP